jgi:hypothetical protein
MEMSPRNLGVIDPPTARLVLNILIAVIGLALGLWLLSGGTESRPADSPLSLICGAFLVAASVLLLNSSIRFFRKYGN